MRKPQNVQVLKDEVDGVDDQRSSKHCVDAGVGTEGASSDDGRGWLTVVTDRWMATMTAMAAMAAMATMATMIRTRTIMGKRMCCESDRRYGIEYIGGCSMNAVLAISTMFEGIVFQTRSKSFLTYLRSTGFVSDARIE
jgi:hypothetical protein